MSTRWSAGARVDTPAGRGTVKLQFSDAAARVVVALDAGGEDAFAPDRIQQAGGGHVEVVLHVLVRASRAMLLWASDGRQGLEFDEEDAAVQVIEGRDLGAFGVAEGRGMHLDEGRPHLTPLNTHEPFVWKRLAPAQATAAAAAFKPAEAEPAPSSSRAKPRSVLATLCEAAEVDALAGQVLSAYHAGAPLASAVSAFVRAAVDRHRDTIGRRRAAGRAREVRASLAVAMPVALKAFATLASEGINPRTVNCTDEEQTSVIHGMMDRLGVPAEGASRAELAEWAAWAQAGPDAAEVVVHEKTCLVRPTADAPQPEGQGALIVTHAGWLEVGPRGGTVLNVGQVSAEGARTLAQWFGAIADRLGGRSERGMAS